MDMIPELTNAEWNVMECLWELAPCTGRQAVEYLNSSVGWTKSTTLTMLRRMTDKGLVACDGSGEVRMYTALVAREEATLRQTEDFISRVYKGSVGMMVSAMTEKKRLSKDEIDELYEILKRAEVDSDA